MSFDKKLDPLKPCPLYIIGRAMRSHRPSDSHSDIHASIVAMLITNGIFFTYDRKNNAFHCIIYDNTSIIGITIEMYVCSDGSGACVGASNIVAHITARSSHGIDPRIMQFYNRMRDVMGIQVVDEVKTPYHDFDGFLTAPAGGGVPDSIKESIKNNMDALALGNGKYVDESMSSLIAIAMKYPTAHIDIDHIVPDLLRSRNIVLVWYTVLFLQQTDSITTHMHELHALKARMSMDDYVSGCFARFQLHIPLLAKKILSII